MRNLNSEFSPGSLMPSYCTDFYFLFSEFYMVTYVTDCQRQTPNCTHANISCSTQLEMLL